MLIENGFARIVRSMGYGDFDAQIRELQLPVEETFNLRQMIETGQPLMITDTRTYQNWVDIPASRWIRSMTGVPIRLEGQTIGFLNINADIPHAFTEEHANRLQAFADQVAIAIQNARLYEEVRRYAEGLASLVEARTEELEVERQRIEFILDATGEGVFYTEGSRIFYANAALCSLTGYGQNELIGQSVRMLAADHLSKTERRRLIAVLNQVRNDTIWRGEMPLQRKDGSLFDSGLTISLVGEPDEKPLRAVTIVRNISKEKALQAQKSRLVAHASHELRTPITNLKTRLYLLRRRPEHLEYHLGILEEVTERMKRLVEDLLDISRLERGVIPLQREKLQVQGLIERIVQVQQPEAERKQQSLTLDALPTPLFVYADAERLTQVITNLLTNAINYTPANGTIRVTVDSDMSGKMVLIQVADTGIGIDSDNLPHIFQPFFRVVSEVEGTGLGLSIAKEIIEMHDGTIEVESLLGEGSTFTVRLGLVLQPTAINAQSHPYG
jgi:PAS domain S-box-containing protein